MDEKNPILDYQPPMADFERQAREKARRIAGAVTMALGTFGVVFIMMMSNIPPARTGVVIFPTLAASAVVIAPLAIIGWYQWREDRSRAWLAGCLIGLCVAAMIEGLCFGLLR